MSPRTSQTNRPFEIRDPVHGFISLDETERRVLDSRPMQRLKHIHQLAMTYQVYPGATHKRFEHSLGVMELAGKAFDALTNPANLGSDVRDTFPDFFKSKAGQSKLGYWRRVIRLAALCHDIGHLPFSHAAEHDLLPDGKSHETISGELIMCNEELQRIWRESVGPINNEHVMKLALGAEKARQFGVNITNWETLLSAIIADDSLGVDRMDYLIRDSHHLGVAYGMFDVDRLIQSLRILRSVAQPRFGTTPAFALGIDHGGLHAAEGLLLARYFMFMQVYYHHARLAYDLHLKAFMRQWVPQALGAIDANTILHATDNDVLAAIASAARSENSQARIHAERIHARRHYKRLKVASPADLADDAENFLELAEHCRSRFPDDIEAITLSVTPPNREVPVKLWSSVIERISLLSNVGQWTDDEREPSPEIGYIFVTREREQEAQKWIESREQSSNKPKE